MDRIGDNRKLNWTRFLVLPFYFFLPLCLDDSLCCFFLDLHLWPIFTLNIFFARVIAENGGSSSCTGRKMRFGMQGVWFKAVSDILLVFFFGLYFWNMISASIHESLKLQQKCTSTRLCIFWQNSATKGSKLILLWMMSIAWSKKMLAFIPCSQRLLTESDMFQTDMFQSFQSWYSRFLPISPTLVIVRGREWSSFSWILNRAPLSAMLVSNQYSVFSQYFFIWPKDKFLWSNSSPVKEHFLKSALSGCYRITNLEA